MACMEQHEIESWELEEVRKHDLVLKNSVKECLVQVHVMKGYVVVEFGFCPKLMNMSSE